MGHLFTQGTVDSNEVWMEVVVESDGQVVGQSGGMDPEDRAVDPWSHFVNVFLLDRDGNRINRRNAQDIFTPLYNHQIPPGAADVLHYRFRVPDDQVAPLTVHLALRYRKFDTEYMRIVRDDPDYVNRLPILTLAEDTVTFPVTGGAPAPAQAAPEFPLWQRWNDYGIGLLRSGELVQAEQAFQEVERLGLPDGPLNLARVYLREGRVTHEAPEALRRAREFDPPANEWSVLWFSGLVNQQNGHLDEAISDFRQIVDGGFAQAVGRDFDFGKDYTLLDQLGTAVFERARQERGAARQDARRALLEEAADWFERALSYDAEDLSAHYNLAQIARELGDAERAAHHQALHEKYKPDDNARDKAIAAARIQYPAANHAAESVVIYDLQRPGAIGLDRVQPAGSH